MDEWQKPPWLWYAAQVAEEHGGLRQAACWRSATQGYGGSNTLPILIGPAVDGSPCVGECWGYGWVSSSESPSTYVAW